MTVADRIAELFAGRDWLKGTRTDTARGEVFLTIRRADWADANRAVTAAIPDWTFLGYRVRFEIT